MIRVNCFLFVLLIFQEYAKHAHIDKTQAIFNDNYAVPYLIAVISLDLYVFKFQSFNVNHFVVKYLVYFQVR